MDNLQDYMKSINPFEKEGMEGLFYGAKYHCFKEDIYIGIFTWTKDINVGDSFQRSIFEGSEEISDVGIPDKWLLLPDEQQEIKNKLSQVLTKLHFAGYSWRLENEVDDPSKGFYLSVIDRRIYPRLWKDNDIDDSFEVVYESGNNILEKVMCGSEKDWHERWTSNTIDGCLYQANEWMDKNNIE